MTDYPDWQAPQAHADAIAATGVPLLANPIEMTSAAGENVPASGQWSSGIGFVGGYLAYNITLSGYCSSQGTTGAPLTQRATLTWYADAEGDTTLYSESWEYWIGDSSSVTPAAVGAGPMHGAYMAIIVSNPSSAVASTVADFVIYGTSRVLQSSDWRQIPPTSGISTGLPMIDSGVVFGGNNNVLAMYNNVTPGASETLWQPMPLYAGPVWARCNTTNLTTNLVLISAAGLVRGSMTAGSDCPGTLWVPGNTAGTEYEQQLISPRAPMALVAETGTASASVSFAAIGQQAA